MSDVIIPIEKPYCNSEILFRLMDGHVVMKSNMVRGIYQDYQTMDKQDALKLADAIIEKYRGHVDMEKKIYPGGIVSKDIFKVKSNEDVITILKNEVIINPNTLSKEDIQTILSTLINKQGEIT